MTDHRPLAFVTGASSGIGYALAGGGDELRAVMEANRTTPEPVKAAAHARLVRPD
jgi:NAD(P)-dependent dehydrogenase (short-subunit alcohol dehydrogenase family)